MVWPSTKPGPLDIAAWKILMSGSAPPQAGGGGDSSANTGLLTKNHAAEKDAAAKSDAGFLIGRAALSALMQLTDQDIHGRLFSLNMVRGRELADGMTQEQLGALIGVDRRMVLRWEKGREPRIETRIKIADALGQPMAFFYDEHALRAWIQRKREREAVA